MSVFSCHTFFVFYSPNCLNTFLLFCEIMSGKPLALMHRHSAMWEHKHAYMYLLARVQRKSFLQCLAFGQAEASINLLAQASLQLAPKDFCRAELISQFFYYSSSETQGQIKGARECLNGRKSIYGTKKRKERREEPLGTMSYQTSSKRSPPFWLLIGARKLVFFWHQSEARTAATIWNWSGKTLSPGALLAILYFSSRHIFLPI